MARDILSCLAPGQLNNGVAMVANLVVNREVRGEVDILGAMLLNARDTRPTSNIRYIRNLEPRFAINLPMLASPRT